MNPTLEAALTLAQAGIAVFPCRQRDKRPATVNGFKDATTDERTIRSWFSIDRGYNLAARCGKQSSGLNLVAIDVDAQNGGLVTWEAWITEHHVPETVRTDTPSGGFHLCFDAGAEVRNGRSRVGPGIDVRGEDGYILVDPSIGISKVTGEILPYVAVISLAEIGRIARMPADLLASCLPPAAPSRNGDRKISLVTGDSVADLAREGWDWFAELEADGWSLQRQRGDQSEWTRPGKDPRQGTSATLHAEGPLNVYSTSCPSGGKPMANGGFSFSPWDYIVAFRAGGDRRLAAQAVRGAGPRPAGVGLSPTPDDTTGDKVSPDRLPTLPAEFWDHPFNAHVLAAARARRCGPDALVLNVLLRASILIPPSFLLPPLSGGFSPLNLLGCVVGRTGEGKSVSIAAASSVLSEEHPWLLWDMPLGSGEGVGDVFMMDELEDDEKGRKKRTGRRVQNPDLHAAHFTVDEGAALVEQASRKGATIIPALCKAWTGATLGETNANVMTRRRVRALSYRVSAVINIQPANFHRLFNTANTGTGLTGRFLFAPAADYDMPDVRGDWPGPLDFPALHGSTYGGELDYHPDIYAEVDAAIVQANRHGGTPENVSHANLLRARVAAIYALAEERRVVSPTDWHVSGLLTETSAALLNSLDVQASQIESDLGHKADTAKALSSVRQSTIREQADIAKFKGRIIERMRRAGSMTRREIKDLKDTPRDVLWQALDELLAEGLVIKDGSTHRCAP